jgi:hypothetical protein
MAALLGHAFRLTHECLLLMVDAAGDQVPYRFDEHGSFGNLDPFMQAVFGVTCQDGHGHLIDDASGVDALIHVEDGGPRHLDAMAQGIPDAMGARKAG